VPCLLDKNQWSEARRRRAAGVIRSGTRRPSRKFFAANLRLIRRLGRVPSARFGGLDVRWEALAAPPSSSQRATATVWSFAAVWRFSVGIILNIWRRSAVLTSTQEERSFGIAGERVSRSRVNPFGIAGKNSGAGNGFGQRPEPDAMIARRACETRPAFFTQTSRASATEAVSNCSLVSAGGREVGAQIRRRGRRPSRGRCHS